MPKCHKFLHENKNKDKDSEIHESLRRLLGKARQQIIGSQSWIKVQQCEQ